MPVTVEMYKHNKYFCYIISFVSLFCVSIAPFTFFACATTTAKDTLEPQIKDDTSTQQKPVDYVSLYQEATKDITLQVIKTPLGIAKNKPLSSPYIIKATDLLGNPKSDVAVSVLYPVSRVNDDVTFAKGQLVTDQTGCISFDLEVPVLAFDTNISFFLTPDPKAPDSPQMQEAIKQKTIVLPYRVRTNYLAKGGSICLVDYDKNGTVITTNSKSSSALLSAMMTAGFSKIGNVDFTTQVTKNTQDLYPAAKALLNGIVCYLVYGTIKYEKTPQLNADNLLEATIVIDASCMEIADGTVFYTTKRHYTATGKTQSILVDTLRKNMAQDMAQALLYAM